MISLSLPLRLCAVAGTSFLINAPLIFNSPGEEQLDVYFQSQNNLH
jgi:hypothetical protein